MRSCARRALARLGYPAQPLVPGPQREPVWPPGLVGSLTHCDGYRAAAVARAADLASLGIDAEVHEPLPEGVRDLVTVADEQRMLRELLDERPDIAWDRILFSAKESVYKAWYALAHTWLDFTECKMRIDAHTGLFVGQLLVPGPQLKAGCPDRFAGRWRADGTHVLTAVHVPAENTSD